MEVTSFAEAAKAPPIPSAREPTPIFRNCAEVVPVFVKLVPIWANEKFIIKSIKPKARNNDLFFIINSLTENEDLISHLSFMLI
jgi:hypothetical protein